MKQPVYLLSLTMSGIKNLDKDITIQLYKKTIKNDFDISDYRVKAIYGENGSGKTAIVLGVQILKNILIRINYLSDTATQNYLHEIINKTLNKLHFECEYLIQNGPAVGIYKYSITLGKNAFGKYEIFNEELHVKNPNYSTSKYRQVFGVKNGELQYLEEKNIREYIEKATANLLLDKPLLTILGNKEKLNQIRNSVLLSDLTGLYILGLSIITSLDDSDRTNSLFFIESFKLAMVDGMDGAAAKSLTYKVSAYNGDIRIVNKIDYNDYTKEVKKLERFIKLFKHDLIKIEIDKRENYGNYECALIMNYGSYKVHISYESNGIKKLVKLYDYLSLAMDNKIVFIDEMDSNINDVYLCKIVEFFRLYGKGQLCFTTHSTSPMDVLKDSKNSIDFLSSDSRIVPWRKNGNYTPESLYRRGMIEYLPFNIEAEDFLGILGD